VIEIEITKDEPARSYGLSLMYFIMVVNLTDLTEFFKQNM